MTVVSNTYFWQMIDLRSDTFTKPTAGMLAAMAAANVGDDVWDEDPTVKALETKAAAMFGMEGGLFCASGTMTNQIAIKTHTVPGNEVICEKGSHVYVYEGGGIAFNSSCQVRTLNGDRGRITAGQVEEAINNEDIHKPRTTLVSLENTANRGGGSCYQVEEIQSIRELCVRNNIKLHLDGARLFNALVSEGQTPVEFGELFDSISICLSKGLGAPVGSVLLGNHQFITEAKRYRKLLGGGWRQAGYLAAAGIYALDHHIERLQEDHENAKLIAKSLLKKSFVGKMLPIETNIIIFEVMESFTAATFCDFLKQHGILAVPVSKTQVRFVLHLGVSATMAEKVTSLIDQL